MKREAIVIAAPEPFSPLRNILLDVSFCKRVSTAATCGWAIYMFSNSCTSKVISYFRKYTDKWVNRMIDLREKMCNFEHSFTNSL